MVKTTLIYFITFVISLSFCRLYEKKEKKLDTNKKLILIVLIALPLILLATLRYNVGTDYITYVKNSANILDLFNIKLIFVYYSKEPLYVIFTYLGAFLFNNFVGSIYVYSIIFVFFIIEGLRYYKDKISITLGLAVFVSTYYLLFFNITRQMLAVSIVFFASRYLYEKKLGRYVFWIIIAGMFHKTAYIMIFAYLLTFKLDSLRFYVSTFLSVFLLFPLMKILIYFSNALGIFDRIAKINVVWDFKFLLYIIPEFVILFTYRRLVLKSDINNEIFYRLIALQFPAQVMGIFMKYADRLSLYFGIFQIMLIPLILKTKNEEKYDEIKLRKKNSNNLIARISDLYFKIVYNNNFKKGLVFSWYILYFVIVFMALNSNGVYPYMTIF